MSPVRQRIAAEAASHLSVGFLQGLGYVLAVFFASLAGALIVSHPLGLSGGLLGGGFYIWRRWCKKVQRQPLTIE